MIEILEQLRDNMIAEAGDDAHHIEIAMRAFSYASNRVRQGHAKTEPEAQMAFASFADGFCTGFHRGSGTPCTRQ